MGETWQWNIHMYPRATYNDSNLPFFITLTTTLIFCLVQSWLVWHKYVPSSSSIISLHSICMPVMISVAFASSLIHWPSQRRLVERHSSFSLSPTGTWIEYEDWLLTKWSRFNLFWFWYITTFMAESETK